jgi:hypothetical protein
VPTDITPTSFRAARSFALRAVAWSLGLFGLLRLPWIQTHALLPVTYAQAWVATALFAATSRPGFSLMSRSPAAAVDRYSMAPGGVGGSSRRGVTATQTATLIQF